MEQKKKKGGWSKSFRIQIAILAVAGIFVVNALKESTVPDTASEKLATGHYDHNLEGKGLSAVDAHVLCDAAIKKAAIDPSQVEIPYKQARETADLFGFLWERGDGLTMPNSLGAGVDTVVICRVGKNSRKVDHLEINGDVIIGS